MRTADIRKIAVFRALQLGDVMCTIPAVRALRKFFPSAGIRLIGLPGMNGLVSRFPHYFDGFIPFSGYPGLPERAYQLTDVCRFIGEMQEQEFDLLLQMQGNGNIVNPLAELFGARFTAGFCTKENYCPPGGLFIEYPEGLHEIHRHLSLVKHLGIPDDGDALEFPLFPQDEMEYQRLNLGLQRQNYVCIHPGSRGAWRQWPPSYFAEIADHCAAMGFQIVITGTAAERAIAQEVALAMQHAPIILAGNTTLGTMGVLLKYARAILSNCTGVSHMASALGIPGVIISMDGEPHRWGPLNKRLLPTVDWKNHPDFDRVDHLMLSMLNSGDR